MAQQIYPQGFIGPQPQVQGNAANPSSLQGTMNTPPSPSAPPMPTPPLSTAAIGSTSNNSFVNTQSNPYSLAQVIQGMESKFKTNNSLLDQRNIVLNKLYGMPVSEQEIAKLDPDLRQTLNSGDRNQIEMRIRLINDQLVGRTNSLDKSVEFLTNAYQKQVEQAERERQNAINNVLQFAQVYGSNAKRALTSLYGDQYVNQLKQQGIDIDNFTGVETTAEAKARLDAIAEGDNFGEYTEKQLKAITALNQNISKNEVYKKTTSMRTFADNVIGALQQGNGVSDIAAINQFQKVIDEGAVTRDQDVKLIQQSQSLVNSLKLKIKRLESGDQLSPDQRQQMRVLVESLYNAQTKALLNDPYIKAKTREAELYGLTNEDTIIGELGGFDRTEEPVAPTPSTSIPRNAAGKPQATADQIQTVIKNMKADGRTKNDVIQGLVTEGYSQRAAENMVNTNWGSESVSFSLGAKKAQAAELPWQQGPNPFTATGKPQGSKTAVAIANAIKQVESGGNYKAKGGSGENGAYQFMPATWKSWAGKYLKNPNAPMTQSNQDKVAIEHIQSLLSQGYNARQIALIWNGGTPVVKKGTNKYGVKYDSGAYANKVLKALG